MTTADELLPSAQDCMKKIALAEAEKASSYMRKQAAADAEKRELLDRLAKPVASTATGTARRLDGSG